MDWLALVGAGADAVGKAKATDAAADPLGYWMGQEEEGQTGLENEEMKRRKLASMNLDDMMKKLQISGMRDQIDWRRKFRGAFAKQQ